MKDKINDFIKILVSISSGILLIAVLMVIRITNGDAFLSEKDLVNKYTVPKGEEGQVKNKIKLDKDTKAQSLDNIINVENASGDVVNKSNDIVEENNMGDKGITYDEPLSPSSLISEDLLNEGENFQGDYSGLSEAYSAKEVKEFILDNEKAPKKLVFLTFDDGPSLEVTPKILDILKENSVNASFFYYTKGDLEDRKELIERTLNEGNTIGLHTNSHFEDKLNIDGKVSVEYLLLDIKASINKLKKIIPGFKSHFYRFPGSFDNLDSPSVAIKALREISLEPIDWNLMTGDGDKKNEDKSPQGQVTFMNNIVDEGKDQMVYVVLMHDGPWNKSSPQALQEIINYFKEREFTFAVIK